MNNKGFTVVELITTFCLSAVVIFIFLNVLLIIKDTYINSNTKTTLLINQANLSEALNSKIKSDTLESYYSCNDSDFCYEFNFRNGESKKLIVEDKYIKFGDYVYKLGEGTEVVEKTFEIKYLESIENDSLDSFLVLKISIKNKLFDDDFGVNIVYLYNSNRTYI